MISVFQLIAHYAQVSCLQIGNIGDCQNIFGAGTRTNNKLDPHVVLGLGIEPGWELNPVGGECSHHCAIPTSPEIN